MYTPNSPAVRLLCKIINSECNLTHVLSWIRNPDSENDPAQDTDSSSHFLFEYGGSQVRSDFIRLFLLVLKLAIKNKIKEERKKTPLFKFDDNVSHKENLNIEPAMPTETLNTSESTYDANFPSLSNVHQRKNKRFSNKSNSIPDCSKTPKTPKSGYCRRYHKNSQKELNPTSPNLSSQSDSPLKETNIHTTLPTYRVKCVGESIIPNKLNELIYLYKEILDCRLSVSITNELTFLFNILFNKELSLPLLNSVCSKSCMHLINGLKLLKNKDECYTFATYVLSTQLGILKYVEASCVKSISKFYVRNIDLTDKFMKLTVINDDHSIDELSSIDVCERTLKNIHISSEEHTSNCNNTILLLNYFDSFVTAWNNKTAFSVELFKSKVSTLIEMTNHNAASMALLAERFVKHLIKHAQYQDCAYGSDLNIGYLEKLVQLQKRFVQPCRDTNLEQYQPHEFNHAESFFSDFISHSYSLSLSLNLYIKQSLICTFNQIKSNLEENGVSSKPQENCWYLTSIKIMQCLGKYLGLIEFYPFKNVDDSSAETSKIQIKLRSQVQPPMPFLDILKWACEKGFLILVVPWISNYLLMMDTIASELPYIRDLLITLLSLKCSQSILGGSNLDKLTKVVIFPLATEDPTFNSTALLFKLPEDTSFFMTIMIEQIFTTSLAIESKYYELINMDSFKYTTKDLTSKHIFTLDNSNIINREIILETCHKFKNLKYIPTTNSRYNYSSSYAARHVTPTRIPSSSLNQSPDQVLDNLEASFCSGYIGLNAIIDFLASQTSQLCEKMISDILFRFEKMRSSIMSQHLQSERSESGVDTEGNGRRLNSRSMLLLYDIVHSIKTQSFFKVNETLEESLIETKAQIDKEILLIKDTRLLPAFRLLHDPELPQSAILTAEKILCKKFDVTLDNWMKHNIPSRDDLLKISLRDLKTPKAHENKSSASLDTVEIVPSLVEIQEVVDFIFLEGKIDLTTEELIALLNATLTDALKCKDSEHILSALYIASWDLLWGIVTCFPHLITKEFILGLTKFWSIIKSGTDVDSEKRLLCPRNIKMAIMSPHKNEIPRKVALIFDCLVSSKLMTLTELEDQSLILFRSHWSTDENKLISNIFDEVKLIVPKCTNEGNTGLLFDWMHETSHQLEDFY